MSDWPATELQPREVIDWELTLNANYVHVALRDISESPDWHASLGDLLPQASHLLKDAMDLRRELDSASDLSDRSYLDQPSISEHAQNRRFRDWTALIELSRDALSLPV